MQRVIHEYRNKSPLFNILEGLYTYISDTDFMFDDILWLDESFRPLCDILESKLLIFRMPEFKYIDLPEIPTKDTIDKEITVCLSGGKDSAACAKYYIDRGYKVHLYHAHGVNKAYGDEQKAAEKIAKYLGCDLFIDTIRLDGTHRFIEHPLKNYMIANGALHYALAKGYSPRIAFGNFNQSEVDTSEFEICGGDCIEMWNVYKPIIRKVIPDFDIEIPLRTNADTFEIMKNDWQLFRLAVSCMSPFRFREHWKHRTEQRYNIKLFDNRCGCCWKCCMEAMWLMDTNKMDYNEAYYKQCMQILLTTIQKESNLKVGIMRMWNNYMFYPIEKSHGKKYLRYHSVKYSDCGAAAKIVVIPRK